MARSLKKGLAKVPGSGRRAGTPNKTTQDLKDALLESAALLGHLKEVPVVNEKGEPTGKVELIHDGEGGMVGYLLWLGKTNPSSYAALLGRVLPYQVNQRTEQTTKVVYQTIEEARAALIAKRVESCRRSLVVWLTRRSLLLDAQLVGDRRGDAPRLGLGHAVGNDAPDVVGGVVLQVKQRAIPRRRRLLFEARDPVRLLDKAPLQDGHGRSGRGRLVATSTDF